MEQSSFSQQLNELVLDNYPVKYIEKGRYLFQEGASANELFYILNGKVQISKIVPDGRELTLRLCSGNELIGETILFSEASKHMMNAKMIEGGEVIAINKEQFEQEIHKNSQLAIECISWLSAQHRKTQTMFRDLLLHGKKGALYSTLLRIMNSYGVKTEHGTAITVAFTNQDLANFCGTSREVINRMLADLRKQNVLSMDKGFITIHDVDFLRSEIDCENCPIDICKIN